MFYIGSPCENRFTPVNGHFTCTEDEIGVNCTLHCMDGYSFAEGATEKYHCAYKDGIWKPPYSTEWPDCSCKFYFHYYPPFLCCKISQWYIEQSI